MIFALFTMPLAMPLEATSKAMNSKSVSTVTISVYSQPGINGGGPGDCSDEVANLQSIALNEDFVGIPYTILNDIQDGKASHMADKLSAADFFFMPDMESSLKGWTSDSYAAVKTYVEDGGVLLMTGTYGKPDVNFLNTAFGFSLSSTSCSGTTTPIADAIAGTIWETSGITSLSCPSATSLYKCGSTPMCTPLYGNGAGFSVGEIKFGSGIIVMLGWDFFNSGFKVNIPGTSFDGSMKMHKDCSYNTDGFMTAFKTALNYASLKARPDDPSIPGATVVAVHGDPMFQHAGQSQHFWLKEGVLNPLLAWQTSDGHSMSLQGVTVSNPETGHQWFKQIAIMRDHDNEIFSAELAPGDKPELKTSSLDNTAAVMKTMTKGHGDDTKTITQVEAGGMTFHLTAESAHKFDDAANQMKYAHVNVKMPNGLIEGATGLFAELAGAKPMSEATKALLRSPE